MIEPDAHRLIRPVPPIVAFTAMAVGLLGFVVLAASTLASTDPWAVLFPTGLFAAGMLFAGSRFWVGYPHPVLGACNAMTQVRAAITALLVVPILQPEILLTHKPEVFLLAALALSLDGVDGWLARRAGLCSDFGARFDMEVDSALAAILASLLLVQADHPAQIAALLVLGFSRYAFVLASVFVPWLMRPLPDRWSRKTVCVMQIGALIAVLALPALGPILPFVAAAVLWSFGRDILWLARPLP